MRVLAVGNLYPPAGGGGYERIFASTVEAMRRSGHDVEVLTTAPVPGAELPPDLPAQAGVHRELRWWWRDHGFPKRSLREVLAIERHNAATLQRHLDELPDVVSWWAMGGMSLSLIERVRRAGIPSVGLVGDGWMHYGPQVDAGARLPWRRPVDLRRGARWLFISHFLLDRAPVDGEVVSPGIDPERFPERPPQPWAWRLACIGRLEPRKGAACAIDALRELPPQATLTFDGPGEPDYLQELRSMADGRVFFRRSATEDVPEAYAAADAVLFPVTWEEPWGLVPLEAMATGRPVIATATGGAAEYLVHEENALVVAPHDPAAIAAAVRRLADDEPLRARLRAGGLATAARFSQPRFEARVVAALEREASL
jgi:glycosyltransferase involved in cell wall biosynthesis